MKKRDGQNMNDTERSETSKRVSSLRENKIRVASSIQGMNAKIQTKIEDNSDMIYWRIKFNMELDERTVTKKHMNVTDTRGFLLKTDVRYDNKTIILIPVDSYESNRYYLLNISKKVRAESGTKLKQQIHILFKLMNNQVSEFEVLKSSVKTPTPKKRPKDYEKKHMNPAYMVKNNPSASKVYSFDKTKVEASQDKLLSVPIKINVIIGIIGLLLSVLFIFLHMTLGLIVSLFIILAGVAHIIVQITNRRWRSVLAYNKGVRYFNQERYTIANAFFQKALMLDPENEIAEFATAKITFYL